MEVVAERLKSDFATALHYWPFLIGGSSVLSITLVTLIGWWALSRVMARLLVIPDVHKLDSATGRRAGGARAGAADRCPVPLSEE